MKRFKEISYVNENIEVESLRLKHLVLLLIHFTDEIVVMHFASLTISTTMIN